MSFKIAFLTAALAAALSACGGSASPTEDQSGNSSASVTSAAPSCRGFACNRGEHCELEMVECIRAPCPPEPECVPDTRDACTGVTCPVGQHCELEQVICIRAPCDPVPVCK